VPDSKLARKREERLRKQAEKDREDREKAAAQAQAVSESERRLSWVMLMQKSSACAMVLLECRGSML
jgi:hypothetical protein